MYRTLKSQLHHCLENLHIATTKARTKSFAEVLCHMGSNIDTNFISQCGSTHGEPKAGEECIQLLGVNPFL